MKVAVVGTGFGGRVVAPAFAAAVDALRCSFGEITSVDARARIDVTERPDDQGRMHPCTAEDGLTATLGVDGGITVSVDTTFVATAPVPPRLVVCGAGGVCEIL